MWVRLWIAFSVSITVWTQHTNTKVQQSGSGFEWGWQLAPGAGPRTVGQYYVRLPQSEQRVVYTADSSGYHGAVNVNTSDAHHTHTSTFALGQKAIDLNAQQAASPQLQQNSQSSRPNQAKDPVDIYVLQQQFSPPISAQPEQYTNFLTSTANGLQLPNYSYNGLTPLYNIQTQHPTQENKDIGSSKPLNQEAKTEQTYITPVVQVFKDHNCSDHQDDENVSKELDSDLKKSQDLFAEVSSFRWRNINGNFGARNKKPLSYRGEASFRVETPRPNVRSERFYHTTEATSAEEYNATQEGISRLVASTQDLITNEDLIKINNAIEQHLRDQSDDLIKPRQRFSARKSNHEILDTSPTMITVKAKIANILKEDLVHKGNNPKSEQILQTDSNEYKFSSPIVVAESFDKDFNKQVYDNVVSTVVPYLQNGYEIIGIKNAAQENQQSIDNEDSNENLINVTPRPIGSNYLAPITVALRLLNSNDNDTLNYEDDHEAADSELIAATVEKPNNEKTTVEIQQSIPLEVTHINDVEYHEYLDEGRSNNKGAYGATKNLYNKYVEALSSSRRIKNNLNKILNKYNEENSNNRNSNDDCDSKEQMEASENVQDHVEINPNGENGHNQRSELGNFYDEHNYEEIGESESQKIIQPIIIEKEVPVTKFVNRYIEKQVPYTETVTVPVPVDRPVPYPVEVQKVVEKPVQVTKYVDKPYPVDVPRPYPVEVRVPYPVQQKVYVDRPVHIPYPVEKIVEKQVMHHVPVPTPIGIPVEVPYAVEQKVFYPYPVDRPYPVAVEVEKPVERVVHKEVPVPYPVEKRVPYPVHYETKVAVPYPVEKRVPVPVEKIIEKPVTVTQVVEKPVHIQVPVPHPVPVHVHHPYPVEKIVEKKVPYPVHVDRIVEKKVHVKVPYPVEKIVERIVEKPVVVTKYVDKPYPVEKYMPYPVDKKASYSVQSSVGVKSPYQFERPDDLQVAYRYGYKPTEEETRHHPQYQIIDQNELRKKQYENLKLQYEQYLKEYQREKTKPQLMQSTHWGNHYASSYQYINNTVNHHLRQDAKKNQALENYGNYLTLQNQNPYYENQRQNVHNPRQNENNGQNQKDYYVAAQSQNQNSYWDKNKNYLVEVKVRRTDRVPKVTIEYGGFKPPLIPSTEVDLDGIPVNKSE